MKSRKPMKKVKNTNRHKNIKKNAKPRAGGLTLWFMVFVILFLAGTAFFVLVQHQFTMRCDVKARRIESKTAMEKSRQERLRLSIAKLKSPGRVARIAGDELGLTEPSGVIYLKYTRDAGGNMICQSTFEERQPPGPAVPKQESEQQEEGSQAAVEEGPAPITRR